MNAENGYSTMTMAARVIVGCITLYQYHMSAAIKQLKLLHFDSDGITKLISFTGGSAWS